MMSLAHTYFFVLHRTTTPHHAQEATEDVR